MSAHIYRYTQTLAVPATVEVLSRLDITTIGERITPADVRVAIINFAKGATDAQLRRLMFEADAPTVEAVTASQKRSAEASS